MNDRQVINEFITHLNKNGYPGIKVDRWPEDENRSSPDIDAIANNIAIEHTSIDTVENQRRDDSWFLKALGDLESELKGQFHFRLRVTIPYDAIQTGQDWYRIKTKFRSWLLNQTSALNEGSHFIQNVDEIPFSFWVKKSINREPALIFYRTSPTVVNSLSDRLYKLLNSKIKKLEPYKSKGFKTILLIESADIAHINDHIVADAIGTAYNGHVPKGIDHTWFVETAIENNLEFFNLTEKLIPS
jgi:hypothetical protein